MTTTPPIPATVTWTSPERALLQADARRHLLTREPHGWMLLLQRPGFLCTYEPRLIASSEDAAEAALAAAWEAIVRQLRHELRDLHRKIAVLHRDEQALQDVLASLRAGGVLPSLSPPTSGDDRG